VTKSNHKTIPILVLFSLALFITTYLLLNYVGDNHNYGLPLTLDQFKQSDKYQYNEIEWGSSVDSVTALLPYPITTDSNISGALPENVVYYKSQNRFFLDGQSSSAAFEFYDGKLKTVKFDFHLDENYAEWFDAQVEKLLQLYGKENDKMAQSSSTLCSKGYKWETDDTTLQIILLTGTSIKPAATLGVGVK